MKENDFYKSLQIGTIIRNKGTGTAYIITEINDDSAIAIRTMFVRNPSEWEIAE